MKIISLSDMHGTLPDVPPCDLVCICGDISPINNHSVHVQKAWFEDVFLYWINSLECRDVLLVPGNHDIWLETLSEAQLNYYEKLSDYKLSFLINETIELFYEEDKKLTIFGTPYCTQFGKWAFMRTIPMLMSLYEQCDENVDIILSHDAPYLQNQGMITEGWQAGKNVGSRALDELIKRVRPKYFLHGHIHSSLRHNVYEDVIMKCVSIKDEKYESVFPLTVIDYEL